MTKEETKLTVQENPLLAEVKEFIFKNHKEILVSDTQMAMCLKLAHEYNLSPLKREIHFLPFRNSTLKRMDLQPVIAYTEYIKKAQSTGNLDGYKCEVGIREANPEKEIKRDMRCTVIIYRKDWKYPLERTIWYSEVAQKSKDKTTGEEKINPNRKNKPDFMMKKVAIAQGMRLAFPEDLGAMPYEEAEAWNLIDSKEVKPETEENKTVQAISDDIHNEDPSTADPRLEEQQKSIKLNLLSKKRIEKMGINQTELLRTWANKKYGKESADLLTEIEIGEMLFEIQDRNAESLKPFIDNMSPTDV